MRRPVAADQFYPGSPKALKTMIAGLLAEESHPKIRALVAISPHAGYVYSGALAAKTLSSVEIPETVIILGPKHHMFGAPVAVSNDVWQMPFGPVQSDSVFIDQLIRNSPWLAIDPNAHNCEHSIEVQIPFLQYFRPEIKIVPIVIAHLSFAECSSVAKALASTIKNTGRHPLIVASTDMSHYESRANATRKDQLAIDCMLKLAPEQLYTTIHEQQISMCGVIPVVVAMLAAKNLGGSVSKLIGYTDSGYITGDISQVVGYTGLIIH